MDIREFIDELYQLWAKTTGAENMYWMPEQQPDGMHEIWAVGEGDERVQLSLLPCEDDANFITAIHGALPDLVRRTHEALDEADRLDEQRDEQEIRIAGLEETIDELNGRINELEHDLSKASK